MANAKPPKQLVSLTPFCSRDWVNVSKEYAVVFPTLDIRYDNEDTDDERIKAALYKPVKGEYVILNDHDAIGGSWWENRIIRDITDVTDDSGGDRIGFELALITGDDSFTQFTVGPGKSMTAGIYVELGATTEINITDEEAYLTESVTSVPQLDNSSFPGFSIADMTNDEIAEYYIVLALLNDFYVEPSEGPDLIDNIYMDDSSVVSHRFGLALIYADDLDDYYTANPTAPNLFTRLGVIEIKMLRADEDPLDTGVFYINNIYYSRDIGNHYWDKFEDAFPIGPSREPFNGGVIRPLAENFPVGWFEEWTGNE